MNRRQIMWSLIAGGVILALLLAKAHFAGQDPMKWQAGKAEAAFQKDERRAEAWLGQDSLWIHLAEAGLAHPSAKLLLDEPTGYMLFRDNRLLFWTEASLSLSPSLADSLIHYGPMLYRHPSRYYYLKARRFEKGLVAVAAIPFPELGRNGIQCGAAPTRYPLRNAAGTVACYLSAAGTIPSPGQRLLTLMYLLAFAGFVFLLERGAHWLAARYHAFAAFALALLGVFVANKVSAHLAFPGVGYLEGLSSTAVLSGNLAQLAANSILALWLLSFAQRYLKAPTGRVRTFKSKMMLASLGYFSIAFFLLALSRVVESLVLESGLEFDFRNVFTLGPLCFTGVASLALLLFWLLLYSLWLGKGIARMELAAGQRLIAQATALLGIMLAHTFMPAAAPMGLFSFLMMALLYLALLDLFIDRGQPSLAWFTLWLAVLAAFGATFLFKYNLDDNRRQHLQFAQALAEAKDSLALDQLGLMATRLSLDSLMPALIGDTLLTSAGKASVAAALHHQMEWFPYLAKNFQMEFLQPDEPAFQDIIAQIGIDSLKEPAHDSSSWIVKPLFPNQGFFWFGLFHPPLPGRSSMPLLAALRPSPGRNEKALQELIPKGIQHRYPFDYLTFYQGRATPQRGQFEPGWLAKENWPEAGSWHESLNSQRALLYYRPEAGYRILVKEELGGYIKPLSLFSFLFALLMLLALIVLGANQQLHFFPATPGMLFWGSHSLRHRIQLSVIGLSLGIFLFIGLITVKYFQNLFATLHQEQLYETMARLAHNLQLQGLPADTTAQLAQLAEAQNADLLLYGLDGQLKASSAPFLFENKFRAPRINPVVLAAFRQNDFKPRIIEEQIGGLSFLSAYLAVPGSNGQPAFYLHIPYSSSDRALQQQVLEFIGTLLNLYVFLLLIAGAIAIAVANSITRPLAAIGEKLRSFKLGKNEPLVWERQDEIGKLVAEYNQMAVKLEERTEALKQSEREGAWREMAKQVAHEIKNPLTPMKLSIQYLQQTQRSDPERARSMIERVSNTLVEQIDGLARIASEFSDFAKMSKAQNEYLSLNEAIISVYYLFTEHQEPKEDIRLFLPEHPVFVFADKGHLVRVLTNLIKNAQQAIPEDRRGRIDIRLHQNGSTAMINVSDNGSGIPEDVQPSVFQPNFTTKTSGMGLGLAMCKGMIEAAGGTIHFETRQGEGTDFIVVLPVDPERAHQQEAPARENL
ncbi:MAG: hypothetical protein H6564_07695 [Lewinellaceae bacterium]|nr:hypothetical protein [Lewinellaceae bacterium]